MKKLINLFENPLLYYPAFWTVILVCLTYWTYLYFTTQMIIVHDAIGYETIGRLIHDNGWRAYFEQNPGREPLYVGLIALSMKFGEIFSLDYQHFQKLFQVILLFSTQLLLLNVLDNLKISRFLKIGTLLYFGFSPAIVNGAFSLYSEIIAYPFVILSLIFFWRSWQNLYIDEDKFIQYPILTSIVCLLLVLGKSAFQYVCLACLLPFLIILIRSLWTKNKIVTKKASVFIITFLLIFGSGINCVKYLNKKYNGKFVFAGHYNFIVLGNAIKKTRPLTKKIIMTHLTSVAGTGVCNTFFSVEECKYADWFGAVETTVGERAELLKPYPKDHHQKYMLLLALDKIKNHPFRYGVLSLLEVNKMFFWESTQIGYVKYPDWLRNLYANKLLRYPLRLVISILSLISVLFLFIDLLRKRVHLFEMNEQYGPLRLAFSSLFIIISISAVYGSCYIIPRYALPIASLYLIAIACLFNSVFKKLE